MVSWFLICALVSEASGPGFGPDRGHCMCCVFGQDTSHSQCLSVSTQVHLYKWIPDFLYLHVP